MDLKLILPSGEGTRLICLRAIASTVCFLENTTFEIWNVTFTTKRIRKFLSLTEVLILSHKKLFYEVGQF